MQFHKQPQEAPLSMALLFFLELCYASVCGSTICNLESESFYFFVLSFKHFVHKITVVETVAISAFSTKSFLPVSLLNTDIKCQLISNI